MLDLVELCIEVGQVSFPNVLHTKHILCVRLGFFGDALALERPKLVFDQSVLISDFLIPMAIDDF